MIYAHTRHIRCCGRVRAEACPCPIGVKLRKTGQGKGEKADKEMPV
jgi:hypothetical protein